MGRGRPFTLTLCAACFGQNRSLKIGDGARPYLTRTRSTQVYTSLSCLSQPRCIKSAPPAEHKTAQDTNVTFVSCMIHPPGRTQDGPRQKRYLCKLHDTSPPKKTLGGWGRGRGGQGPGPDDGLQLCWWVMIGLAKRVRTRFERAGWRPGHVRARRAAARSRPGVALGTGWLTCLEFCILGLGSARFARA